MAALATIPGRPLGAVLRTLRPQVDTLVVFCNGFYTPPDEVLQYADDWDVDPENSAQDRAKFAWAATWRGVYLTCDDDILYPADYVSRHVAAIKRFGKAVISTAHGRIIKPEAENWGDQCRATRYWEASPGFWCNWAGTGVSAFHTTLRVPPIWPGAETNADGYLARWCQERQVPIWCLPRHAGWIQPHPRRDWQAMFEADRSNEYANVNAHVRAIPAWRVYTDPR